MTFPHHRSAPATGTARASRGARSFLVAALAILGLALASCGVDAGQDAAPTTEGSSASTTAAPTTEATTTTTEDEGGVGGVGGTNGDKTDKTDKTDEPDSTTTTEATDSGGVGDSTGEMTVDEISQEFQSAGLPKEQADCIAEIVHDADLTKGELDEFTRSADGDTAAGKVLTDAMTQCFGLGE